MRGILRPTRTDSDSLREAGALSHSTDAHASPRPHASAGLPSGQGQSASLRLAFGEIDADHSKTIEWVADAERAADPSRRSESLMGPD